MKLIDKDKVDEILRNLWKEDDGHNSEHRICYNKALQEVQCEIDTLDVKDVDLEKEFSQWWKSGRTKDYNVDILYERYYNVSLKLAKYFFELGLKVNQKGE